MNVVDKARIFATAAHAAVGQRRKYLGTPYIEHPRAVAELVAEHGGTDTMIAAAWLHDVVEDTAVTLKLLAEEFDSEVVRLVAALSDLQTAEDGNRKTRMQRYAQRLSQAGPCAQTIKYADLIHNLPSVIEHDRGFARVYLAEQRYLIDVLRDGEPGLRRLAEQAVENASQRLAAGR
jgi:(p)ppGpp synthase/HD superfamily hydrolase